MITKIEVDGFKSLRSFSLTMNKGLNIMVGPNGAGKTNIILFFEFLSNLIQHPLGSAVSHVGGAGSIFQKIGPDEYRDAISCRIIGCGKLRAKTYVNYEYVFTIQISFEKDDVYYSNQRVRLNRSTRFQNAGEDDSDTNWSLDIEVNRGSEGKQLVTLHTYDAKRITRSFGISEGGKPGTKAKKFMSDANLAYHSIVRPLFGITRDTPAILSDLVGGETFNVVPSKVRELEDTATPPGIRKDGSGLATTLYAMKKKRSSESEFNPFLFFHYDERQRTYRPETLERIVQFLKSANTSVSKLEVENNPFNNKLLVKVSIQSGDFEADLPLSAMSDGTIKWLTLITAILTSKTIFSIEEPENFLHPWMQAEIAQIMRDHLKERKIPSFVLMTTHSESLLNFARPNEVIIVDFSDGRTHAKRISNTSSIKEQIKNSGFGLGYFYFSNALSDA